MRLPSLILALLLYAIVSGQPVAGQGTPVPLGLEPVVLPAVDAEQIILADERRAEAGRAPHYATPIEVAIDPFGDAGFWDVLPDGSARWRLRLISPGALSLNLAFTRFRLPAEGRLELISATGDRVGPWTALDNEDHGQLWTPPIPTDDLTLDLRLPVDAIEGLELELSKVHHGYAGFGEPEPRSGGCHRDVACSEAEPWADQVRSVALISVAGKSFCSGFLVNNTALDGRPYVITAGHCGVTPRNAPSVVVMWGYQRASCGGETPEIIASKLAAESGDQNASWSNFQTGAIWRAADRATDTLLLELDDPVEPFDVYFAGWDRSPADPTRSVVVHHPNADLKRISFDDDRATTTRHLEAEPRPRSPVRGRSGTHIRVADWDLGSTEGGSSGAPLFNQDQRVVGMLHGGYAACGEASADWFGRFSAAWTGNGRASTRLSDWLDPLGTGAVTLDGLDSAVIKDH